MVIWRHSCRYMHIHCAEGSQTLHEHTDFQLMRRSNGIYSFCLFFFLFLLLFLWSVLAWLNLNWNNFEMIVKFIKKSNYPRIRWFLLFRIFILLLLLLLLYFQVQLISFSMPHIQFVWGSRLAQVVQTVNSNLLNGWMVAYGVESPMLIIEVKMLSFGNSIALRIR